MSDSHLKTEHDALTSGAGFVELDNRCCVEITGTDRKSFLHNFCTNDIKQLGENKICEAFVLNTKGKILGYVHVVDMPDRLFLTGHAGQGPTLLEHLDKYLIREDAELRDVTSERGSVFVCGQQATEKLAALRLPQPAKNMYATGTVGTANDLPVELCHLELAGWGYLIVCEAKQIDSLTQALAAEITACSAESLNRVRVENRTPWFGVDVDETNLPQEIQRDEQAISFNKGCYLGQETVARIDAIGRVNQLMVGLEFPESNREAGDELRHEDKVVGRVTSVATANDQPSIGLGYVRRKFADPGTELETAIVKQ